MLELLGYRFDATHEFIFLEKRLKNFNLILFAMFLRSIAYLSSYKCKIIVLGIFIIKTPAFVVFNVMLLPASMKSR